MPCPARARARYAAIVLAMVVPLASCGEEPPDPYDAVWCEKFRNGADTEDAFEWLKASAPIPRRAGTWSPEQALAIAHKFEARGAARLYAVGNRKLEPPAVTQPCLFSYGLLIELPDEPAKRYQVFQLYAEQVRDRGYRPRADRGQKYLFFTWPQDGSNS